MTIITLDNVHITSITIITLDNVQAVSIRNCKSGGVETAISQVILLAGIRQLYGDGYGED